MNGAGGGQRATRPPTRVTVGGGTFDDNLSFCRLFSFDLLQRRGTEFIGNGVRQFVTSVPAYMGCVRLRTPIE